MSSAVHRGTFYCVDIGVDADGESWDYWPEKGEECLEEGPHS